MRLYFLAVILAILLLGCTSPVSAPKNTYQNNSVSTVKNPSNSMECTISSKSNSLPPSKYYVKEGKFRQESPGTLFDVMIFKENSVYYKNNLYSNKSCEWIYFDVSRLSTAGKTLSSAPAYNKDDFSISCNNVPVADSLFKTEGGVCDLSAMVEDSSLCFNLVDKKQKEECLKIFG